jgi:hypothetical protein
MAKSWAGFVARAAVWSSPEAEILYRLPMVILG